MKIAEYQQMMDYLTGPRERFNNGGFVTKDQYLDILAKEGITIPPRYREMTPGSVKAVFEKYGLKTKGGGSGRGDYKLREMKFKKPTKLQLKDIKEKFGKFSGEKYSKSKNILNDPKLKKEFLEYANNPKVTSKDIRNKFKIGTEEFYKGGLRDIIEKDFQSLSTSRLKAPTIERMLKLNNSKIANRYLNKGELIPFKVIERFGMTGSEGANAVYRLAQVYGGKNFNDTRLDGIKVNKKTSNKIFKSMEKQPFGNPYHDIGYQLSLDTIDETLGRERGTFKSFKSKAREVLAANKIKGFDINEMIGVTGSAKVPGGAEFSQFIDVMDKNLNRGALASFQSSLSRTRQAIADNPASFAKKSKKINQLAVNFEKRYGIKLPRIRPTENVTKYFSPKRLTELKKQGIDLVKASKEAGYTYQLPKGAMTIEEFLKPENKKTTQLLAALGCPDFKGKQVFQDGGRIGFQEGTTPTAQCIARGAEKINNPKLIKPGAEARNAAQFLNKAAKMGRTVMKFGVIPEAIWVAGASLYDMGQGASLSEALLRGSDYLLLGNQGKMADRKKFEDTVGPVNAEIILRARDYKESLEKLETAKTNLETNQAVLDGSEYGYTTSVDEQNQLEIDKQRIKDAEQNVKNKFQPEAVMDYEVMKSLEAEDIRGTKNIFKKIGVAARDAKIDDIEQIAAPGQEQQGVAPGMFGINDFANAYITDKDLQDAKKSYPEITKEIIFNNLRKNVPEFGALVTEALFTEGRSSPANRERFFGTQGLPSGAPIIDMPYRRQSSYIQSPLQLQEENKLIEEGARFGAAGGGIMKIAGKSSGPPPRSGPTPQGLDFLIKRGRQS